MALRTRTQGNQSRKNYSNSGKFNYNKQRNTQSKFVNIGGITSSKADSEDGLVRKLNNCGLKLWVKVYTGKDRNAVELRQGDYVMISFNTFENDPDFVLGHLVLPPEEQD